LSMAVTSTIAVGCGKGKAADAPLPSSSLASPAALDAATATDDDGNTPMDARESAQWAAARDGDPEESMRLVDLVGCAGLYDRAASAELRPTALLAAQYCPDFSELPWLAQVGTEGSDVDARAALGSAVELAARPRRSVDPEDADELHAGCAGLLSIARATERPRERRVLAIRALRMLVEYGCVAKSDIPTDLDAR
jgi:hypothetical protein